MKPIKYHTGEEVKLGDSVIIERSLSKKLLSILKFQSLPKYINGEVIYVYDPNKESPLKGENEYGITIKLNEKEYFWGIPGKETELKSRRKT